MVSKWEGVGISLLRSIPVASRAISGKLLYSRLIVALSILFIACCIVTKDMQGRVVSFADILADHVKAVATSVDCNSIPPHDLLPARKTCE